MSRKLVTLVYERKIGSMLRKAVLSCMADRANDDGSGIWLSKGRIADEIEASRRSVITAIQGLVDDGILIDNGLRRAGSTHDYSIRVETLLAMPEHDRTKGGCEKLHTPDPVKHVHGGVKEVHRGCEAASHKPSYNRPEPKPNGFSAQDAPTPPKAKTKRTPKRGSRMSETWAPTQMDYAHATKAELGPQEINHEADQFRDYHISKGTISKDWSASWRTWCRNAVKWKAQRRPANNEHNASPFIRGIEEAADILDHASLSRRDGQEFHPARPHPTSPHERGGAVTLDADGHVITSKLAS